MTFADGMTEPRGVADDAPLPRDILVSSRLSAT
jgi:hypothetical protein